MLGWISQIVRLDIFSAGWRAPGWCMSRYRLSNNVEWLKSRSEPLPQSTKEPMFAERFKQTLSTEVKGGCNEHLKRYL